ncbi:hypothetical protein DFR76_105101 [Nocardia pseudobrasiliensis]|uniref:Uncharacterized protein n=2 Tax=Nocardia pseudobrasiliensis TaxID=45979 RepID=A0A370I4V8_9NOCA|nr:hypothetical protein DFR76_105101 [Nocardia pseudobrasiliensis]
MGGVVLAATVGCGSDSEPKSAASTSTQISSAAAAYTVPRTTAVAQPLSEDDRFVGLVKGKGGALTAVASSTPRDNLTTLGRTTADSVEKLTLTGQPLEAAGRTVAMMLQDSYRKEPDIRLHMTPSEALDFIAISIAVYKPNLG